ncbi:MAG: RING finger domain-containing protein [Bacteroidota bacterium]
MKRTNLRYFFIATFLVMMPAARVYAKKKRNREYLERSTIQSKNQRSSFFYKAPMVLVVGLLVICFVIKSSATLDDKDKRKEQDVIETFYIEKDDECTICFEELESEKEVVMTSDNKRVYHKKCIQSWLKKKKIDPITGEVLSEDQLKPCKVVVKQDPV